MKRPADLPVSKQGRGNAETHLCVRDNYDPQIGPGRKVCVDPVAQY